MSPSVDANPATSGVTACGYPNALHRRLAEPSSPMSDDTYQPAEPVEAHELGYAFGPSVANVTSEMLQLQLIDTTHLAKSQEIELDASLCDRDQLVALVLDLQSQLQKVTEENCEMHRTMVEEREIYVLQEDTLQKYRQRSFDLQVSVSQWHQEEQSLNKAREVYMTADDKVTALFSNLLEENRITLGEFDAAMDSFQAGVINEHPELGNGHYC